MPSSALTSTGMVPKTPQTTAAATRASNAMRASHPLGEVTRISRSSSSGDNILSIASWRNRDFCMTPRSPYDTLFGALCSAPALPIVNEGDPVRKVPLDAAMPGSALSGRHRKVGQSHAKCP